MVLRIEAVKPLDSSDISAHSNENGDTWRKRDLWDSCQKVLLQTWESIYHIYSLSLLYQGLRVFPEAAYSGTPDLYSWSPMLLFLL